jgi:curved DNA-binding protein CbpA
VFMIDLASPSRYAQLGVAPTATIGEIRKARDDKIKELRNQAYGADPERQAELAEQETAINALAEPLVRPAKRDEYDREHADLRTLTVRDAAAPLFADPAHRTAVLHRALTDHLTARGARLYPPSDLHRSDFTADETPNPLLDDLLAQRRP